VSQEPGGVRLRARQARSVATFERILEAAGALFDEVGVEATTMDAIAERAGVSIGSVYRFFANKSALKDTLTARWEERVRQYVGPVLADDALIRVLTGAAGPRDLAESGAPPADLPAWIDAAAGRVATALREALDDVPGARGLLATTLRESSGEQTLWLTYLERYLALCAPDLPPVRRTVAARTFVTVTAALVLAAVDAGPDLEAHLDEVRAVLAGYTRQLVRESAAARAVVAEPAADDADPGR
jgi:AcrR family transcriptional regulator